MALPVPAPDPRGPLNAYLRLQVTADREVLQILRGIKADVDRQLEGMLSSRPGTRVRRDQLRLAQRELDAAIQRGWVKLADTIEKQSLATAKAAVAVNGEFDRAIFRQGLSDAEIGALVNAQVAMAQQNIRAALNRVLDDTGATRIPLSQKVYHSRQLLSGQVDRMVNSALARGLTAREFAKEASRFVSPATPGGVRYAAMRLSRTEINNSFHYAQRRDNAAKPWVNGQKWHLSGSHPRPDECNEFAEQNRFDLGKGVYPPNDVPNKPHPHCLCYITPETVSEEEWLRQFQKGEYNDYIDARIPSGLPQNTKSEIFATKAQAQAFVKNSVFKQSFEHVSNEKNAASIAKQGLLSGEGQAAGVKYGRGVYVSTDEMTTAAYERATGIRGLEKGKTITYDVYINVKKPFEIDASVARIKSMLRDEAQGIDRVVAELTDDPEGLKRYQKKYLDEHTAWVRMATSDRYFGKSEELLEKATRERFGVSVADIQQPKERALRAFLQSKGFDSVHIHGLKKFDIRIGGNQILVFEDKNVMITNPVARRAEKSATKLPKPKPSKAAAKSTKPGVKARSADLKSVRNRNITHVDINWGKASDAERARARKAIVDRAEGPIHIQATGRNLGQAIFDGRYKTIHEVAKAQETRGVDYLKLRTEYEDTFMNLAGVAAKDRPVYGYLGPANQGSVSGYGDYIITLKRSVRSRTTVSAGDSLNGALDVYAADAVKNLSEEQIKRMLSSENSRGLLREGDWTQFMEAQIHGGIKVSDIESVTVPSTVPPVLLRFLKQKGIKVHVEMSEEEKLLAELKRKLGR